MYPIVSISAMLKPCKPSKAQIFGDDDDDEI